MFLDPRIISLVVAIIVSAISMIFLWFLPNSSAATLFVGGVSSFTSTFFLFYYVLDVLIFQEISKIYETIKSLKIKDFNPTPRKQLVKLGNPLKKLGDELFVYVAKKQQEVEELRRLEQFRREFLADVSHELKTPIFAAQGFIHTLLDGAMDDMNVREKFLKKAAKSLDGLDALVHDLLMLSHLESGAITMNREVFNLQELINEVAEQLETKTLIHNIKLTLPNPVLNGVWVSADRQRISQVLTNLIDNALKYGRKNGNVWVSLEANKNNWAVLVKDDGPGIAPQHLNRIFERFYRIEKSRSKEMGGTGLGLAIVKHIVNAHQSKIQVMSKLDKGTIFKFKLPEAAKTAS